MKHNKIPTATRLKLRIATLEAKLECWSDKKYYPQCKHCGITNVDSSNRGGRHYSGCPLNGVDVNYYKNLLSKLND